MKRRAGCLAFCIVVFAACALYPLSGVAQRGPTNGGDRVIYGYHGSTRRRARALRFGSVSEAVAAVDRILKVVGLTRNFVIEASHDVDNAESGIDGNNRRYIYYNPAFMERITNQARTDWAALAIMAHEVGHHLLGHRIEDEGRTPREEEAIRHRQELEADRYSGFTLRYLGASPEQAQSAIAAYGEGSGSPTHPPMKARLDAVREGWDEANGNISGWMAAGAGTTARPAARRPSERPTTIPELRSPRPAQEPPRAISRLSVDNTSTRLSSNRWSWTAFIKAPPEVLEQVGCVVYQLHPTFRPAVVRVCERGAGDEAFALKADGWGSFEMQVYVLLKDGRRSELSHWLRL